jgi:tRNA threonylcarbamoyladenosine biosynthesis protein TsaE
MLSPPMVVAVSGAMGAGKTTLISSILSHAKLASGQQVTSPTFSIINLYDTENLGKVCHIDAYRLKTVEEALNLDIPYYYQYICFIEWWENIAKIIPPDSLKLQV